MTFLLRHSPAAGKRIPLGVMTLLILQITTPAASAQMPLYDRMLMQTRQELLMESGDQGGAEYPVSAFVAATAALPQGTVKAQEINDVLGDARGFCTEKEYRKGMSNDDTCNETRAFLRRLVDRESAIRSLGRDLQNIIAGSYERPLLISRVGDDFFPAPASDAPSGAPTNDPAFPDSSPDSFLLQMQSVTSLWRMTGEGAEGPPPVTGYDPGEPSDDLQESMKALTEALEKLRVTTDDGGTDDRRLTAAVWAMRYGRLALSREAREEWKDVADALDRIIGDLSAVTPEPPPEPGQTVFLRVPGGPAQNVVLWAYVQNVNGATVLNAGLDWEEPIEPVLPALCTWKDGACEPVLAGAYPKPPEPPDLCSHVFGEMGYLCRTVQEDSETACGNDPDVPANTIALARCADGDAKGTQTTAGPAMCELWAEGKSQALENIPRCTVQVGCENEASGGLRMTKEQDGTINLTLGKNDDLPAKYRMLAELAHAKRACEAAAGATVLGGINDPKERAAACCRANTDAYAAACKAMNDDGAFAQGAMSMNAYPLNEQTCIQALTEKACRDELGTEGDAPACPALPVARLTTDDLTTLAEGILQAAGDALPEGQSASCENQEADPRVGAAMEAVNEWRQDVCTPGNSVTYKSTIGNAQCYMDLCLLQSLRDHRLVPGANTLVSGAVAQPFDMCVPEASDKGTLRAEALPPLWAPAAYNPGLFLKQAQIALCLGGPPSTLCGFDLDRVLRGATDANVVGTSALRENENQQRVKDDITEMADALGQRIGNDLYAAFLQSRMTRLSGIVSEATDHLTKLTKARFTETMCPTNPAERLEFLSSQACTPTSSSQ